jgi:hypothetical protein
MTDGQPSLPVPDSNELSQLLKMYEIVFDTLRHEGSDIWERFNILVGIN